QMQQSRALNSRRTQGLQWRHADLCQKAHLVGNLADEPVCPDRDIQTAADRSGQTVAHDWPLRAERVPRLLTVVVVQGLVVKEDAGGDDQPGVTRADLGDGLIVDEVSVLDAVDA